MLVSEMSPGPISRRYSRTTAGSTGKTMPNACERSSTRSWTSRSRSATSRVNSPRAMSQHAEAWRAGVGRRSGPSFANRRTWAKPPSERARWPPSADCCVLVVAAVLRRVDSPVRANEHRPIGGFGSTCRRSFRVSCLRRHKRNANATSVWRSAMVERRPKA